MALAETLLFYLVLGIAVAFAVAATATERTIAARAFEATTATLFWPLYLPVVLARRSEPELPLTKSRPAPPPNDDAWATSIAQVERELDEALASLDGWAESALATQQPRIAELRIAWRVQADRIREMDRLLAAQQSAPTATNETTDPRAAKSEASRRENLTRLQTVRDKAASDLTATLASVRQLVSMIHLAKFTGAPASRADELVNQIAAAIEGVSEAAAWEA